MNLSYSHIEAKHMPRGHHIAVSAAKKIKSRIISSAFKLINDFIIHQNYLNKSGIV